MPSLEELLSEANREVIEILVTETGKNSHRFEELVILMEEERSPVSWRASWVAYHAYAKFPWLAKPYLQRFLKLLLITKIDGTKRSLLKILYDFSNDLSEDEFGQLADLAFTWAEDPKQAIAVKAFSIDILLKVIDVYPEAKPEVIGILESIIPDGSRGLKNKCLKTLKQIKN